MSKPTLEEYEQACKKVADLSYWVQKERIMLNGYLDAALETKKTLNTYEEALEVAKETKLKYELYEELVQERKEA